VGIIIVFSYKYVCLTIINLSMKECYCTIIISYEFWFSYEILYLLLFLTHMYILQQFQEFETEKSFDTVQILVGGRTEDKSVNLATLSGKQDLSNKLFVSASNFMIIKFSTDASVERKGFRLVRYILRDELFGVMNSRYVALGTVSGMF